MTAFEFTRLKPGWQLSRPNMENMNTSMTLVWGGGLSGPGGSFWAMTAWCLGCWPLWLDWLNTRWTWGWPETCSCWQSSRNRTGLLKTASPLCLGETQHTPFQGQKPPGWRNLRVCRPVGLSTSVGPARATGCLREAHVSRQLIQTVEALPREREMNRSVQGRAQLTPSINGTSREIFQIQLRDRTWSISKYYAKWLILNNSEAQKSMHTLKSRHTDSFDNWNTFQCT